MLEITLWLNNLIVISVRDTLNYQKNYRNNFGWVVSLTCQAAKLDILIISLVCRCIVGFPKSSHIIIYVTVLLEDIAYVPSLN